MKKLNFNKIVMFGLTAVMTVSALNVSVFAETNTASINSEIATEDESNTIEWIPVPDNYVSPRVGYNKPTTAYPYSLATPFTDTFWDVSAAVNTGKSDYYFYPSGSGSIRIYANGTIHCTIPSATIKCYVKDLDSNWNGATITLSKDNYGNYSFDKTITGIPSGTKIYYEFEVFNGSGAVLTGSYTTTW